MPNRGTGTPRRQFCPAGHDTFIVGRRQGQCNACRHKGQAASRKARREREGRARKPALSRPVREALLKKRKQELHLKLAGNAIRHALTIHPDDMKAVALAVFRTLPDSERMLSHLNYEPPDDKQPVGTDPEVRSAAPSQSEMEAA